MCQNPLSFLNKWCWCSNCTFYSMSLPLPSGHCQWKHLNFSFRIVATFTCTTAKVLHSLCAHRYSLNVYFAKKYFFLTISFHVCSWLAVKTHQSPCIFSIGKFTGEIFVAWCLFPLFTGDTSTTMPCTVALSWASTTSDASSSSFLFSMLDTDWKILDSQLFNLDCKERGSLHIRLKSCTVTYHFIAHGGTTKTNYQSDCYKRVFCMMKQWFHMVPSTPVTQISAHCAALWWQILPWCTVKWYECNLVWKGGAGRHQCVSEQNSGRRLEKIHSSGNSIGGRAPSTCTIISIVAEVVHLHWEYP